MGFNSGFKGLNINESSHVWIWIQAFLITELEENKWLASRYSRLYLPGSSLQSSCSTEQWRVQQIHFECEDKENH